MDRHVKKRLRSQLGEHMDVSGARLTDDETAFLVGFVDAYNEKYRGKSESKTTSFTGYSSDGKYTRTETTTYTFTDEVGIRRDYEYHDDDGQTGSSSSIINDARGLLNWFKDRP